MNPETIAANLSEWYNKDIHDLCLDDRLDCDQYCDCMSRPCLIQQAASCIRALNAENQKLRHQLERKGDVS